MTDQIVPLLVGGVIGAMVMYAVLYFTGKVKTDN